MSNSRDDAGAIDFLDAEDQPSPELLVMHRRLEADGAAWRRRLPSTDSLQQWVSHGGLPRQAKAPADTLASSDLEPAANPLPQRPTPSASRRIQGFAAVSAALAVVLLFGLLIHTITGSHIATSTATPTAAATRNATAGSTEPITGKWTTLDGLTFTSGAGMLAQAGFVAIAPSDTNVVYEAALSPVSLRRTRDGGASWQKLTMPSAPTTVAVVEIYVSPLDANDVFLTITGFKATGDVSPCTNGLAAANLHGGILASGQISCSTTYRSTNGGAQWKLLRLPVAGAISAGPTSFLGVAANPLQAQGNTLYALVNCGANCSGDPGFILKSTDNGATWKTTGPPGRVCAFTALPDHSTIFAATASGPCGIYEGGASAAFLERSDDGGESWRQIGRPPNNGLLGMAATYAPGTDNPVLYVESPQVETQSHSVNFDIQANSIYASSDNGAHWTQAPSSSATPTRSTMSAAPIFAGADGSIVLGFTDGTTSSGSMRLLMWRPGQRAWQPASPPLNANVGSLLSVTNSYWVVAEEGDANATTIRVYRYTP